MSYGDDTSYDQTCCLIPGNYTLTCIDSFSDGWHGGYIRIGDSLYCDDFDDGGEQIAEVSVIGKFRDSYVIFSISKKNQGF